MGAESNVALQMHYLAAERMDLQRDCGDHELHHMSDSSDITSNGDHDVVQPGCDLPEMMAAVMTLLGGLGEDAARDGLLRTPLRVAKAFRDATIGYQQSALEVVQSAMFEEAAAAGGKGTGGGVGGMVVVRNIEVYSLCEGCLLPFRLRCHVGYIPSRERVVGLSKLARVAEIYAKRLQSPQRFVDELAQAFTETLKPLGVAVISESWHLQWPDDACENFQGKETTGWTHSTVSARRGQFAAGDTQWTEFRAILALEGTKVKLSPANGSTTHHDCTCPFSAFDTSIAESLPPKPSLSSNGHGQENPRPSTMIKAVESLLRLVGDDPSRAHLRMTPWRFAGWLWRSTQGSRSPVPRIVFDSSVGTKNDMILGEFDLAFQSQCEHHLLPFLGVVHVGYLGGKIDRKSVQRVVRSYSSRLQVQERLTRQVAEAVGGSVMVVVEAVHMCMLSRGVHQHASDTVTYASLGSFASDVTSRTAFLQIFGDHRLACKVKS